jgi:hypothetical protein
MGLKNFLEGITKNGKVKDHLIAFLEDEYGVQIVEKYQAFLLIEKGKLVEFFYNSKDLRLFLEKEFVKKNDKEEVEETEITDEIKE